MRWFSGPPADAWIGRNGLGWTVTILVSGGLYAVLPRPAVRGADAAPPRLADADRGGDVEERGSGG